MNLRLVGALLSVYIFWGATFLGMRVGVETIPPMILICLRFVIVGAIMLAWAWIGEGKWRVQPKEWRGLFLTAMGMFICGNGLYAIALQHIPSSIATLIGATGAVWMVLLDWYFAGKRPSVILSCGLLVSLVGIGVLVGKPETGGLQPVWLGVCLFASMMWTFASYGMRLVPLPSSTWVTVGWQNFFGGLGGAVLAAIMGEWNGFSLADVSIRSWEGMIYLIFIGSLVGFTSYQWLMVNAAPMLAATTVLVNPVVAMFFGWILLNEPFTFRVFLAFVLVLTGVIAIIVGRNRKAKNN